MAGLVKPVSPSIGGTRLFLLALAATVTMYVSSPVSHPEAQGSSAGSHEYYGLEYPTLYRIDNSGIGTAMGNLSLAGCDSPSQPNVIGMDVAPDGTFYGLFECSGATVAPRYWGWLDPETAVITPIATMSDDDPEEDNLFEEKRFFITFKSQFGDTGSPIGYRLRVKNDKPAPSELNPLEMYAIDALSPYREHLLYPAIWDGFATNTGIGAALAHDGSGIYWIATDAIYKMSLDPVPPSERLEPIQFIKFLQILITGSTVNPDENGQLRIFSGPNMFRLNPDADTIEQTQMPLLRKVSVAVLRRAPHGGVRVVPHELLTTSESGTTATFTAVLTNQPLEDVTVNFTSTDTSEGTVSPSSATFTPANWKTPQTITVTGVLDNDIADQTFRITTSATSADANYHDRSILDVDVTNTHVNQPPSMTAGTPSARQGSPAAAATLGTVSDFETAAAALTVSTVTVPSGVTVGTISNSSGTITAPLSATCVATTGERTLTMRVTDAASATFDRDVTVTVNANTAPTLGTYSNTTLAPGNGTTVNASVGPADNGSIAQVTVSSPDFTGSLSVDSSTGHVTISNAGPAGVHTVTITATDNCDATFQRTFTLTVNTTPSMTAGSPSVQQGSPAAGATLGTVSDTETAAGSLTVSTVSVPSGLTVGTITNTSGTITAPLSATCVATTGNRTLTMRVTDALGGTFDRDVTVDVTANAAPTLGTYSNTVITPGAGTTVNANAAPADNGSVSNVSVTSPDFTGSLAVDSSTGHVTISNAGPAGVHTVTVTATDNCDATFQRTFTLTVNTSPSMTAGTPAAQQGSPAAGATLGTVSDAETAAGSLAVTTVTVPTEVTVGTITNTSGTITAPLSATCVAATGNRTLTLRVTDALGGTFDRDVTVNVTANAAPTLGTYGNTVITPGSGTTVNANAAPADNGSVSSVSVSSPDFTGSLSVDSSTGHVTVSNAGPAGVHTVTVTATDNCDATFQRTFTLTVNTTPSMTAGTPAAQQGSPAAGATLGTVSDAETAAGSLAVTTVTVPAGVTVGTITNTSGTITAPLSATCVATTGNRTLTLRVTDAFNGTFDRDVTVNVTANAAPTLGTYGNTVITPGAGTTVNASASPADNGSVSNVSVSSPDFTGSLVVDSSTGHVTISNAGPAGVHTVTITATDNCDATFQRTFTLTVNTTPSMTAGTPAAQQGSPATGATLGTVSDAETAAGSLAVTTVTVPAGVTVGTITNTSGTITAPLSATCVATTGNRTLTLRVTDAFNGTFDRDVTVDVTANAAPTLGTYSNTLITPGSGTTVNANASPADNGSVSNVSVSSPDFTGSLSVDSSTGHVTVSNAGPAGVHTVTVTATDNCDATFQRTFTLTVNTTPSMTAGSPSVQQGSPAAGATLGTVSDAETAAGSLAVTTVTVPTGVTVGTITNTSGTITAPLSATCTATTGDRTLTLRVTDAFNGTFDRDVTVNVTANAAPTLGTYSNTVITPGSGTTVNANAAPADNVEVTSITVSSPDFTGSLSVDSSTGNVTISNAGPAGVHTVTMTVTDNCDATFQRTFTLTVNTTPSMTAGTPSAQQGSPATGATLGTVSDAETAAGSLAVTTVTVPTGVTVGTITNTSGTITAPLSATCVATTGNRTLTMRVTDAFNGTFDRDVTVNVTANAAPTLGTYSNTVLTPGSGTTVNAGAAPADNGVVSLVSVSSPDFTGSLSVDSSTGHVTVSNAGPAGVHTVTVTATDNCDATFQRTFTLTVNTTPSMTAGSPSVQQGSPAAGATLGTVSDAETAAGSLAVTTVTVPTGITVGTITNTSGTITAPLSATCSAPLGARTLTMRVTDALGATFDRDVIVNVIANAAPTLGVYSATTVAHGGATTAGPAAAPADNGSIDSIEAASSGFTGTLSASTSTGVVSIGDAGPGGTRVITVTATDNCGATVARTFDLTVSCPAIQLSSSGATFSIGGGSGSVGVTSATGCGWSGSSPVSWIVFGTESGTGNGTATFTVAENRTGAPRSADLTLTGKTFTVSQQTAFSDPSLAGGATPIRAVHIRELRIRIDVLRSRLNMAALPWTDPSLTAGQTPTRAVHINELRTAIIAAYVQAQRTPPSFPDTIVAGVTVVRAAHLTELRAAVEALESSLP